MSDRVGHLHEKLRRIDDARKLSTMDAWGDAWRSFEQELLERLLKCGPDDDVNRYRLQIAIETARHVRRTIEASGAGGEAVERELAFLEGRKLAPIA